MKISRYKHTFTIRQDGERHVVWVKKVGVEKQMLADFYTEGEAVSFVKDYVRDHKIPFTKPTEQDPSKASTTADWTRIGEQIAGTAGTGDEWLAALLIDTMPVSQALLKKAYRAASLKAHPDHGGSDAAQRKVTEAYNHLKGKIP